MLPSNVARLLNSASRPSYKHTEAWPLQRQTKRLQRTCNKHLPAQPYTCPQLRRSKLRKRILLMETRTSQSAAAQAGALLSLDNVDLQEELGHPSPTLQDVPPLLRAAVRGALVQALERAAGAATGTGSSRALGALHTGPRMLLARTATRATAFQRGEWLPLLQSTRRMRTRHATAWPSLLTNQACAQVQRGEISRARQVPTTTELAPGNEATWAALTDPARPPPAPRTEVPPELLSHQPAGPASPTQRAGCSVRPALGPTARSAWPLRHARGAFETPFAGHQRHRASYGGSHATNAGACPRRHPPTARLTASRKPDGSARGIATGDVFRRLVSKTLARQ